MRIVSAFTVLLLLLAVLFAFATNDNHNRRPTKLNGGKLVRNDSTELLHNSYANKPFRINIVPFAITIIFIIIGDYCTFS